MSSRLCTLLLFINPTAVENALVTIVSKCIDNVSQSYFTKSSIINQEMYPENKNTNSAGFN